MSLHDTPGIDRLHELEREYELIAELGRGGSSIVYLAREKELNRDVAIKVVRSNQIDDAEAVARLAREAKLVATLRHPNIVPLLTTRHLSDGSLALVMQHIPGRTLKSAIRDAGQLPIPVVEHVLREVGSALEYAHRRHSVVHRDIKPENIYLDEECGRAMLSDFGIARPGESESNLTLAGTALGTPAYMSPEQIDGIALDGRSDLYSLGLVAYEMLTGQQPWVGSNLYTIIYKQKNEELPDVTSFRSDVPPHLQRSLARLLNKDRADRWSDAAQFLAQLPSASTSLPVLPVSRRIDDSEPPSDDSPTLRYQRDDVSAADEQEDLPEIPAAAAAFFAAQPIEPVAMPLEPRPAPPKRSAGRSYVLPEAAPMFVDPKPAPPPARIESAAVAPAPKKAHAAHRLNFAQITRQRQSRLVVATTIVLVLGGSATVVAMIGKDKGPKLRADATPITGATMAAISGANNPLIVDSTQLRAAPLVTDASSEPKPEKRAESKKPESRESREEKPKATVEKPKATEEKPKSRDESSKPRAESVKQPAPEPPKPTKALAKSEAPPLIGSEPPPAAPREQDTKEVKVAGNETTKPSEPTVEPASGDVSVAPVFTPYTVKPELKNRDAVQRTLSRNYPRRLRESGIGGAVMVWALIDESGKVVKSQVKEGSGIEVLDQAALKVADAMRFSPALNRDQKVRVWIALPLIFKSE